MDDSTVDLAFSVLPFSLRRRIDLAFDNAIASSSSNERPARKKRKLHHDFVGGGFIPESESGTTPGGFIVEEPQPGGFIADDPVDDVASTEDSEDSDSQQAAEDSQIPLSLIPSALQLLDLQPDDEDVLAVFRNAASGWAGSTATSPGEEQYVGRKDWRAVCAALLDAGDVNATSGGEDEAAVRHSRDESSDSADEYRDPTGNSDSTTNSDASDEEYQDKPVVQPRSTRSLGGAAKPKSSRKASKASAALTAPGISPQGVTPRQRTECRRTFALFFPDVDDANLDQQRLMIKDISRVAALLKEKITAEEIVEMLGMFSTFPDKSMSLSDFEKMMLTAKLA